MLLLIVCGLAIHAPGLFFGHHRRAIEAEHTRPDGSVVRPIDATTEAATNEVLLYPALRQAGNVVRSGEVPLWNDKARFGEPFGFSGAPIWYPPYWLVMADLGAWSYDLLLALHTVMAAVAMARFLRTMTLSRYVSFLGGASYGLGWFLTANLDRLPEAAAAAILPIALECTWRCLSQRRSQRLFVPCLGLAIAAMFATGSTTTAWTGLALCAAVLAAGMSAVEREHRFQALRMAGAGATFACLLSAPLWVDWIQHQPVTDTPSVAIEAPRAQPIGAAAAFAPGLFGDLRGHGDCSLAAVNPGADPLELALYPGVFVLFLGLLGLFRPKRTYSGLFWLGLAGIGLLLALDSPLHQWLGWSPGRPGAILVLFHVATVVMAAISLETFFDAPIARRHGTLAACMLTLLGTATVVLCGAVVPAWGDAIVAWLVDADVATDVAAARRQVFQRLLPPAAFMGLVAIAFLLWRRIGILRFKPVLACIVLADLALPALVQVPRTDGQTSDERIASRLPEPDANRGRAIGVGRLKRRAPPSWLAAQGQAAVDTDGRAILDRSADFLAAIDPSCVQTDPHRSRLAPLVFPNLLDDRLVDLAAIGIATSMTPTATTRFHPLTAMPAGIASNGPHVLLSADSRPRARIVHRVDHATSQADASIALRNRSAGSKDAVLLEGRPREFTPKAPLVDASVEWIVDTPNRIELRADLRDGRGYLVLSDAFAPGWTLSVDGAPADILPGDLAFRAVALREGQHDLVFSYRPWAWTCGVPAVLLGLLLAFAYWLATIVNLRNSRAWS